MPEQENANRIPQLPCPNCGESILEKGFYNTCTETQTLREDNYATVSGGRMYLDHSEDDHDVIDHECDADAYCTACDKLLPWTTFDIRDLDGLAPAEATKAIAELLEQQPQA